MGKTIRFTEFGTVLINDAEIDAKTFWEKLETNLDGYDYGVDYNAKKQQFTICFKNCLYNVILSDKEILDLKNGVYSPLVKKLMILSRVQRLIDTTYNNTLITTDTFDKETRDYYLSILRMDNRFTKSDIIKYFQNLKDDISDAWGDLNNYFDRNIDADIIEIIMFLGVIINMVLGATVGGIPTGEKNGAIEFGIYFLLGLGGLATPLLIYPIGFIIYHTKYRIGRLVDNIKTKKLNSVKIKNLERTIHVEQKEQEKDTPFLTKENRHENISKLSEIIDHLLDSLKEVSPSLRGDLVKKIRSVIEEYKVISLNKKDFEIVTMYPDFLDKLNELEIEIQKAKSLSKEQHRDREIAYLEDKLREIEENKGYSYKKTKK